MKTFGCYLVSFRSQRLFLINSKLLLPRLAWLLPQKVYYLGERMTQSMWKEGDRRGREGGEVTGMRCWVGESVREVWKGVAVYPGLPTKYV